MSGRVSGPEPRRPALARRSDRGLSPVVGTLLLVAVVVALASLSAVMVFGLIDQRPTAPQTSLDLVPGETAGTYDLVHRSGDVLEGDQVRIHGVVSRGALSGAEFAAGESVSLSPIRETVRIVWTEDAADPTTYTLATFDVTEIKPVGAIGGFGASVFTSDGSDLVTVEGDGGAVERVGVGSTIRALGTPGADVTGDGTIDMPFVDGGGDVSVVDPDGDVTTVAADADVGGSIGADKTRLVTGSWDGSPASVFFVDQSHDTIYRATPSGSPIAVASPGDGAQAITGIGDVDGDDTDELVFADASQQLRYLEPDGTVQNVNNGQTGSNNGIGAGTLVDLDGDGTPAIVAIDGSNDLKINREPSGGGTTIVTAVDAAKAPPTAADVDGDGDDEAVYVDASSGDLRYVDDVGGSNAIRTLADDTGSAVAGSDETGTA
jgi:flagellin-like protein